MQIGITGANGFIGNHLVRHLREAGHAPIAFLQPGTSAETLEGLPERVFRGEITDSASLDRCFAECEAVIHLAGINRYWAADPDLFHRVNVQGTREVAEACLRQGVRKLVHASSCITLGASADPTPRDESASFNLPRRRFPYADTKKEGEELIKRYGAERGLSAVIVHPTSAIGERDYGPTPIGKPIADICRGMWPAYVAGGACFIDVRDVARGFLLALTAGRPGERYLLAGDNLTNEDFMTRVSIMAGRGRPRVKVPRVLLQAMAHGSEWMADHLTRRAPALTVGMVSVIGKYLYFDGGKARRELDFHPRPVDDAIRRCIAWFRSEGKI